MSSITAGTTSTTTLIHSGDTTGSLVFKTNDTGSGGTTAVTIDTSQNVGIGTSSPAAKFHSAGGVIATGSASAFTATAGILDTSGGNVRLTATGADSSTYGVMTFNRGSSNASLFQENMRIDSSGYVLINKTSATTYGSIYAQTYTVNSSGQKWLQVWDSTVSTAGQCQGLYVNYSAATPNGGGNEFIYCIDSTNQRFSVLSNGGIKNYSANNVNLSDRREKTNFAPAKSYLNTICSIPVQTFNYIDQNREEDDGLTLGVVAQDVQEVAPELVHEANWGTEDNPKMRLSIYQTDLQYALMKAIQELKAINDQQAETINAQSEAIASLTARVVNLEGQ